MVDFNNETTVATPPGEIVKVVILERREQVIESLESFHGKEGANIEMQHIRHVLRSRIMALWYQLQAMVKRRLKDAKGTEKEPSYEMIKEAITNAANEQEIIGAFEWMNEFIDDMGLTFIDARPRYKREIVEDANLKKGL